LAWRQGESERLQGLPKRRIARIDTGRRPHQGRQPLPPERIGLWQQQQFLHRESLNPGQGQQALLHLLGKHCFAAAVDGAIETPQQLPTLDPKFGPIAAAPPTLIKGQGLQLPLLHHPQSQAGGLDLQRSAAGLNAELDMG
jgi:hypothetical protein